MSRKSRSIKSLRRLVFESKSPINVDVPKGVLTEKVFIRFTEGKTYVKPKDQ